MFLWCIDSIVVILLCMVLWLLMMGMLIGVKVLVVSVEVVVKCMVVF